MSHSRHPKCTLAALISMVGFGAAAANAQNTQSTQVCSTHSTATSPVLLELYTSEGCSSCPPADLWVSSLRQRPGVVALAFHVDYWDRLGWADRFASADNTRRQMSLLTSSGARFAYTPQLIVQGQDWPRWPATLPSPGPSLFDLSLKRDGRSIEARIQPRATSSSPDVHLPTEVTAYWAWTENGHRSAVRQGENAGRMLQHDAVVRAHETRPPWPAREPQVLSWQLPVAEKPGQAVLVITDARTRRPLQVLTLGC